MEHALKAVVLTRSLPLSAPESLEDVDRPSPEPKERDLRVQAEATPSIP